MATMARIISDARMTATTDDLAPAPGSALLHCDDAWWHFADPVGQVRTSRLDEVTAALDEVDAATAHGLHAVGFLSYEAAPAFDDAFVVRPPGPLPLLHFGLYRDVSMLRRPPWIEACPIPAWSPSVTRTAYRRAIARIKDYIAAGDTYQVNYTLRLRAAVQAHPWTLFSALCRAQRVPYGAYLDLGDHALCSASPELFFRLAGKKITCRPMKGTAPRGLTWQDDEAQARALHYSMKNRAENVMIVDMMRNDLGRIARASSVRVPTLFAVERYATLLQMTSTVQAETRVPLQEILRALFPCASITGAPKVRTMEIIAELETAPRGIYTGSIGWIAPGRRAQFNVAIRTVHVDRGTGWAEYGTGGGIVWDSRAEDEYEECRTKALVLFSDRPAFCLLETLLWKPDAGYYLRDRHLARLADAARYFNYPLDLALVTARLDATAAEFGAGRRRVRLLVAEDGEIMVEAYPLERSTPRRRWRVALATTPVEIDNRFLYHKTTQRAVYESARAACPDCDDIILWNTRGEVTEATLANVVIRRDGTLLTPPVACGLLAGVFRAELLARGRLREAVITCEDLTGAEAIYLINSVRGWIPVDLVDDASPCPPPPANH